MTYQTFVLATRNPDKIKEIRNILHDEKWQLLSLRDFPNTGTLVEDGKTLLENALKKARLVFQETGIPSLADDTGLEVDALNGAPGVRSRRFAGEMANYRKNNEKLLRLLQDIPDEDRTATFRCFMALVTPFEEKWVEGICKGVILSEYRGQEGFGYDPLFYVPEKAQTFAEMSQEEKNIVGHRGKAFRKMAELIRRMECEE